MRAPHYYRRFDLGDLTTAAALAAAPVSLGALLLLAPWGAPPTSAQLLTMEKAAADAVVTSLLPSPPPKPTPLRTPTPGSWRQAAALVQAYFLEPWSLGSDPKPRRTRVRARRAAGVVGCACVRSMGGPGCWATAAWRPAPVPARHAARGAARLRAGRSAHPPPTHTRTHTRVHPPVLFSPPPPRSCCPSSTAARRSSPTRCCSAACSPRGSRRPSMSLPRPRPPTRAARCFGCARCGSRRRVPRCGPRAAGCCC
ncbi:MAG: hypothetical protein J3K34DRAFT_67845 [Monoraphidium minutum]|nr:MAG: hypothetical protein J3K34DRAFT_67845 [Monoraphidium minutum]